MKLIGKAFVLGVAMAVTSIVACSSNHSTGGTGSNTPPGSSQPGAGTENGTGTVGFQYTLPGGEHISSVTYKLTNGTNTYSGTVNVAAASTISFLIPGVAAGTGYSITLTGTSDDGQVNCIGTVGAANAYANPPGSVVGTTFSVINRATTTVNVNMICLDVANLEAGSVQVNSVTSCCATWDTAVANPTSANTTAPGGSGNTSALSANASGPCGNTDAGTNPVLNCTWTMTTGSGTVSTTTADGAGNFNATFTCPSTGETDTITLNCTDGPLPDGGSCPAWSTTTTATVVCGTPACTTGAPPAGNHAEPASPQTGTGSCSAYGAGSINDGNGCCYEPCSAKGNKPASPFSATGSCAAFAGTSNDGTGCCQPLHPCVVAGDSTCVQCQGNLTGPGANGGLCTPTEVNFVQKDINKSVATAPGPDPAAGCYSCLNNAGCLDDTALGDNGHECEDFGATLFNGTSAATLCENTVSCVLGASCASSSINVCYCGTAGLSTTCQGNPAPGPINGACDTQISTGLGFPLTDGTDNQKNIVATTKPAGRADQIFTCALSNSCTQCLTP